jgi:hypothetical protein
MESGSGSSSSNSNNEELKNEGKDKKNSKLFPSDKTYTTFQKFFSDNKGIEALWKDVENNENKSKVNLYNAETKILELVKGLTKQLELCRESLEDSATKEHKADYNKMVQLAYTGHEKEGKNFLKKFPNWSFNLSTIISKSNHYKRIANAKNFEGAKFDDDFKEDLNIKFNRKEKIKPTGLKGKAGSLFSSIGKFFKNFGKNFTGKASKSGVEKKVQAFFKRVNAPWRRWWEFICDGSQELSQKSAKQNLKKILDSNDDQNAKKAILKFFISPNDKTTKLSWEISDETNNIGFSGDNDKSKINLMFRVFKSLDKELGTKVEALFNGAESAANLDTNDDKIKRLIELHKIFYTDKKAIRFSDVFDKLGIKTNAKPSEKDVAAKVDELFNGSTFSNNENAKKDVKKLAEDARNFLENYYDSDKTNRLLYELKFLGSCFKINDLNKVESVDQAINVLNRLPKNAIQVIQDNDQEVAKIIDEEIAKSAENIKSINDALKNLDKEDFNKPEGQQKLLNALSAIVTKGWIESVSEGKISLVEFINKLLSIESGKYKSIAEKIQKMEIYKNNNQKDLANFIDELKKPLKQAEAQKIKEQNKQIEEKIQTIEKLFEPIKSVEADYNGGKKQLNDLKKGQKIITEIKKLVNYTGTNRTDFLKAVAQHIGINDTKIVDKIAHTSLEDLKKFKVENSKPHLLLRKIRNLIAYGIFGGKNLLGNNKGNTSNTMPDDLNEEQ